MTKAMMILAGVMFSGAVWAACVTHTVYGPNGQIRMCTTCCTGSYCTTTCY